MALIPGILVKERKKATRNSLWLISSHVDVCNQNFINKKQESQPLRRELALIFMLGLNVHKRIKINFLFQ
jgi:hypothetical protein